MATSATTRAAAVLLATTALGAACEQAAETPPPRLTALAPTQVQGGQIVMLQGTGFAAEPGLNAVYFGNARARVESASTTELRVQAPELGIAAESPARVAVRVVVAGLESDSLELDVLPGVYASLSVEDLPPMDPTAPGAAEGGAAGTPVQQASGVPAPADPAPTAPAAAPPARATPAPTPAPKPRAPAPRAAPAATPAPTPAPDPDLRRARQALDGGDPESALRLFESVLERTPDSSEASEGRDRARAALQERRSLVTGETRVTAAPSSSSSAPAGFATDDVELGAEAPPARISFEVRPENVRAGAAWRLAIFLANDSDERIDVKTVSAEIRENGQRRAMAPVARTSRVGAGAREHVGDLAGAWGESPESWSVEVAVVSDDGDRYVCRLIWQ